MSQQQLDSLMEDAQRGSNATLTVDLVNQSIKGPDGGEISFEIDADRKHRLLNGIDDIGESLQKAKAIDEFEAANSVSRPWA